MNSMFTARTSPASQPSTQIGPMTGLYFGGHAAFSASTCASPTN